MQKKNFSIFAATAAIAVIAMPAVAFAHSSSHDSEQRFNVSVFNELDARVFGEDKNTNGKDDKGHNGKHLGQYKNLDRILSTKVYYNGTVTAISDSGFTLETRNDSELTIDVDSAKIYQVPRTEISLEGIEVGDTVHVIGTRTDAGLEVTTVYVLPANLRPAIAKGTVTAVNDNSITVQTKDNNTITVNTDSSTEITNSDKEDVASADVETGSKVKMFGLWDSVLNIFNAIKIKLS